MRAILIPGGAPRVTVDAVRHLTVAATGTTAVQLRDDLLASGLEVTCLLSQDAAPAETRVERYNDRASLDAAARSWVERHPDGVVVMTAAVNDYQVEQVTTRAAGQATDWPPGSKVPSRAEEVMIRLRPAPKLIDQLASWGHAGPLVACKYEDSDSVLDAAERLRERVGAAVVLANSLDGTVQALVDEEGVHRADERYGVLAALVERIVSLAQTVDEDAPSA